MLVVYYVPAARTVHKYASRKRVVVVLGPHANFLDKSVPPVPGVLYLQYLARILI